MKSPLVSIGMPVYNGEQWIRRSLNSLLQQDYPNIEIIVSDNVSDDATYKIVNEYVKLHENINVSQNDENVGIVSNFKKVLSKSSGKYFFWAGVDDLWESKFVSALVAELELDDKYAVALPGTRLVAEDTGEELGQVRFQGRACPNNVSRLKLTSMIVSPLKYNFYICGIFRRDILIQAFKYCPDIPSSDRWFLLQLALEYQFRYIDELFYVRTIRNKLLHERYPGEDLSEKKKVTDTKWFDYKPIPSVLSMLIRSEIVNKKYRVYIPYVLMQLFLQRTILGVRKMGRPIIVNILPRFLQKY